MNVIYIMVIFCVICALISVKKSENNFMDKKSTDSLRGLCMIAIVLNHLFQTLKATGNFEMIFLYSGSVTVGYFFFISGYANYNSINKKKNLSLIWITMKVIRIYVTFFIVYFLDVFLLYIFNNESYGFNVILNQLITVKLPYWSNWYLKVQIVTYIVFGIVLMNFKKNYIAILWVVSLLYCYIVKKLGWYDFWWNSILCFPLGVTLAKYNVKEYIKKLSGYIAVPTVIVFILTYRMYVIGISPIYSIILALVFCVLIICILLNFKLNSKILEFVGEISLEIYLWHLVLLNIIFKDTFYIENLDIRLLIFFMLIIILSLITKIIVKLITKNILKVAKQ